MKVKIVEIEWTYPREFTSAWACEHANDKGIYQIYRKFGNTKTLLYIGLVKSVNRCFYQRISEHLNWLDLYKGEKIIRFGKINHGKGNPDATLIEEVESALIYEVQPFENTMKKKSYTIRKDFVIHNKGYRGSIPETIDTETH